MSLRKRLTAADLLETAPSPGSCDAISRLLATITRRWTLHILWILISEGPTRFGALRRRVPGISARVLTVRLRALEAEGLVFRKYTPSNPPEATYGLTARAMEIGALLEELHHVANRWAAEALASPTAGHRPGTPGRRDAARSAGTAS